MITNPFEFPLVSLIHKIGVTGFIQALEEIYAKVPVK